MSTRKPRYLLTGSDDLAAALEVARQRWPEDEARPTALLPHLIEAGRSAVTDSREPWLEARRHAIAPAGEALEGTYQDGYLPRLREDWPQ